MSDTMIEIDYERFGIKDIMSEPKVEADPKLQEAFCKSLGLYWRTWPSEKPELETYYVVNCIRFVHVCFFRPATSEAEACWSIPAGVPNKLLVIDGDRWIPLSAMEKLP